MSFCLNLFGNNLRSPNVSPFHIPYRIINKGKFRKWLFIAECLLVKTKLSEWKVDNLSVAW